MWIDFSISIWTDSYHSKIANHRFKVYYKIYIFCITHVYGYSFAEVVVVRYRFECRAPWTVLRMAVCEACAKICPWTTAVFVLGTEFRQRPIKVVYFIGFIMRVAIVISRSGLNIGINLVSFQVRIRIETLGYSLSHTRPVRYESRSTRKNKKNIKKKQKPNKTNLI